MDCWLSALFDTATHRKADKQYILPVYQHK